MLAVRDSLKNFIEFWDILDVLNVIWVHFLIHQSELKTWPKLRVSLSLLLENKELQSAGTYYTALQILTFSL